jgi:hypothetical protein
MTLVRDFGLCMLPSLMLSHVSSCWASSNEVDFMWRVAKYAYEPLNIFCSALISRLHFKMQNIIQFGRKDVESTAHVLFK